jgi:putative restriction endonuclease
VSTRSGPAPPESPASLLRRAALCRLHHAAFDANILGIRPDYEIEIRLDVPEEVDGPMLKHGLQQFHRERLWTPRRPVLNPKPEFLEERYALFRRSS